MNACSPACGWCGACDDGIRERGDDRDYLFCDHCGRQIYSGAVSLAGVGVACSRLHLDILAEKHALVMQKRAG